MKIMKIYGIAREVWGGYNYSCNYDEDISLFFSKEERDKKFKELNDNLLNNEYMYSKFETTVEK